MQVAWQDEVKDRQPRLSLDRHGASRLTMTKAVSVSRIMSNPSHTPFNGNLVVKPPFEESHETETIRSLP